MSDDWRGDDPWRLRTHKDGWTYWENTETGEREIPKCAMVRGDLPAYFSVASGKWVDGRKERRDDLARTGCVPWEPDSKRYDPKGFGNPRFAKKHGLKLSEEAVHRKRAERIDPLKDVR